CGSESPMLGGVPHPNNGVMAGGAAAAAAALTLADPHAADRKPEQRAEQEKKPVDVKEEVPASVFDHLDGSGSGTGSGHEVARPHAGSGSGSAVAATPPPATTKKLPMIPSPHDAVDPGHADTNNQ
ncbi:MAG TPA: hypothetical protein VF403_25940, partial [Kofleriaceae bacterium]